MQTLYVLYDAQCVLCRRCRAWLGQQAAFVPLTFLPLQSPEVTVRFPGIEAMRPEERLVVVSDTGDIWRGEDAWILCLWALREYREWSLRLAHPLLRPFARRVCELISENRHALGAWFSKDSPVELGAHLAALPAPAGANEGYRKCL